MSNSNCLKIISGSAHRALSESVASLMNRPLVRSVATQFSDGETRINIEESVRECSVYVIQPTCAPTNDTFMELCILLDGLKRATAKHVTVVMPYYGYARQDKKVGPREPITARMIANFLESAGANRVISVDVHSEQIQGFFDIPFDHLYAGPILGNHFRSSYGMDCANTMVVSPDVGGSTRAAYMASYLGSSNGRVAVVQKQRPQPNEVEAINVIGDVAGRRCLIYDDMADTCKTLVAAANILTERGATAVDVACTHPVLSGDATRRLQDSCIENFVCLDTLPITADKLTDGRGDKIKVLTVAPLLAQAIQRHYDGESLSSLFDGWSK